MEYVELIKKQATVVSLDPAKIKRGWRARQDLGDVDGLALSIKEDGQMQPIIVRKSSKTGALILVAGMRRVRACRQLKIPVKAVVVTPRNEVHALSLQIGENVKRKDFDMIEMGEGLQRLKMIYERLHPTTTHGAVGRGREKLAPKFVDLACRMLGLKQARVYELLGFANLPAQAKKEISEAKTTADRNLAAQRAVKQVRHQKKEDKLKKAAEKRRAARATAEEAGEEKDTGYSATLYPGDCFKLLPQFKPDTFDLIFTDPPYELKRSVVAHMNRASINSVKDVEWDQLDVGWFLEAAGSVKPNGQALIFCPLEAIMDYRLVFTKAGWKFRCTIIWHRTNPGTVHRSTYLSSVEAMVWATKGDKYTFTPWGNGGAKEVHNFREYPICSGKERLDHPAQKPLAMVEEFLLRHSVEGDAVLDPFAGVATMLVACKLHDRYSVGIEKSADYVRRSKLRLGAL